MVTLEEAKAHCRLIEDDFDGELQIAIAASVDHLASIGVDMASDPLPPALKQATLMLVAHFFENKEAVSDASLRMVPLGVDRLIAPYRSVSL